MRGENTATKGDKIWDSDNRMLNLLTPKADKHLFSPYIITPESNIKGHENTGNDQ